MACLFYKAKYDISRPGAVEIAHDEFVLRNLEIVGRLVDVVRIVIIDSLVLSDSNVSV